MIQLRLIIKNSLAKQKHAVQSHCSKNLFKQSSEGKISVVYHLFYHCFLYTMSVQCPFPLLHVLQLMTCNSCKAPQ